MRSSQPTTPNNKGNSSSFGRRATSVLSIAREESRVVHKKRRARFFASLRMTAVMRISATYKAPPNRPLKTRTSSLQLFTARRAAPYGAAFTSNWNGASWPLMTFSIPMPRWLGARQENTGCGFVHIWRVTCRYVRFPPNSSGGRPRIHRRASDCPKESCDWRSMAWLPPSIFARDNFFFRGAGGRHAVQFVVNLIERCSGNIVPHGRPGLKDAVVRRATTKEPGVYV